jgi:hypothetical protein
MRHRSAVEPVIGHLKDEHRMSRNYLAHRHGDINNPILAAVGYNFRRLIKWLRILLCLILRALFPKLNYRPLENPFFTDDYIAVAELTFAAAHGQAFLLAAPNHQTDIAALCRSDRGR